MSRARKILEKSGWVAKVKTVSTYPPKGTFSKSGEQIARTMARKSVSPKGVGSGIRMVAYFKNRAGKRLKPERRAALNRAIKILQSRNKKK